MSGTSTSLGRPPAAHAERLVFVDVLRVAVIVMVIVHHAAQAYGPTGGNWPVTDVANSPWFRPFYTVNAAIGMGLLFLLAGHFVPAAYDRKGPRLFLRQRWARIGLPLVVFALAVHVPLLYLVERPAGPGEFVASMYAEGWAGAYLHLWFLGHLLLYSAAYVVWRWIADRAARPRRAWAPPNNAAILGFVVGLALVTWIVRVWYPVDEWVPLLFVVAAEPAHLPQYVSLFVIGVMAYRGDWLRRIPARVGACWLGVGLTAAAGLYAVQGFAPNRWETLVTTGGPNAGSLLRSTWETVICIGLSVGLIVVARGLFRRPNRLLSAMATASYAAYILHVWIVVSLQVAIIGVALSAVAKFTVVSILGIVLSFGVAHLSRHVPGVRVLLGTATKRPVTSAPSPATRTVTST